jgi:hypothetical protein
LFFLISSLYFNFLVHFLIFPLWSYFFLFQVPFSPLRKWFPVQIKLTSSLAKYKALFIKCMQLCTFGPKNPYAPSWKVSFLEVLYSICVYCLSKHRMIQVYYFISESMSIDHLCCMVNH